MGQEKVVSSNIVSGLEVAALEGDNFLELPRAYTQESMPVHRGNIPTERDIKQWSNGHGSKSLSQIGSHKSSRFPALLNGDMWTSAAIRRI